MPEEKSGPLAGIRVIELGNFIAAPTAGRLLGEFGAEVIKIERPKTGDETRTWRTHGVSPSLFFRFLGRNKKSVTVDMRTEEGQEIVRRLLGTADALIENFRPGTLEKWGLAPVTLRRANPGLIIVRISGFGQTGPYAERAGFGSVAEAMGGLRHVTGYPGMPPVRVGVSIGDQLAALYAVIGVLLGLHERASGAVGKGGESVDIALYEAVYSMMESAVPDYDAFGIVAAPTGTDIHGVAPTGTYACADGTYVVIGANGDSIFPRLMRVMGREDLAKDPQLARNEGRLKRKAELNAAVEAWTKVHTATEIAATLAGAGVPCSKIFTAADIISDPQYAARAMLLRSPVQIDGAVKDVLFPGVVPKLALYPGSVHRLGPDLGEDTRDVLAELGYDDRRVQELSRKGIV